MVIRQLKKQTMNVRCEFTGTPDPQVKWTLGGKELYTTGSHQINTTATRSVLTVSFRFDEVSDRFFVVENNAKQQWCFYLFIYFRLHLTVALIMGSTLVKWTMGLALRLELCCKSSKLVNKCFLHLAVWSKIDLKKHFASQLYFILKYNLKKNIVCKIFSCSVGTDGCSKCRNRFVRQCIVYELR